MYSRFEIRIFDLSTLVIARTDPVTLERNSNFFVKLGRTDAFHEHRQFVVGKGICTLCESGGLMLNKWDITLLRVLPFILL